MRERAHAHSKRKKERKNIHGFVWYTLNLFVVGSSVMKGDQPPTDFLQQAHFSPSHLAFLSLIICTPHPFADLLTLLPSQPSFIHHRCKRLPAKKEPKKTCHQRYFFLLRLSLLPTAHSSLHTIIKLHAHKPRPSLHIYRDRCSS